MKRWNEHNIDYDRQPRTGLCLDIPKRMPWVLCAGIPAFNQIRLFGQEVTR